MARRAVSAPLLALFTLSTVTPPLPVFTAAALPPLTAGDAALLERELQGRFRWLRFRQPLERDFVAWLRTSQHRSLVACMGLAMVMLLIFTLVDTVRYHGLQGGPEQIAAFQKGVLAPRWSMVAVLGLAIWAVATRRIVRHLQWFITLIMVLYGMTTSCTLHAYGNLGLLRVTGANLLLVLVVFFPCALTFYESLRAGFLLWLQMLLTGPWLLDTPQLLAEHWLLAAYMLLSLAFSAVNGYMREHVLREQFLLRHLLDWKACHDPLTGLANRHMFNERLSSALHQARRDGMPLSMALIDVDHFKAYNDRYGHQAGDEALCRLAGLIQHSARRPQDVAVRLGGEEFAVLAYGDDAASLAHRMQHLRDALHAEAIAHATSPTAAQLTISIGVAQLLPADEGVDALYRQADVLLYAAKAGGRDRVAV